MIGRAAIAVSRARVPRCAAAVALVLGLLATPGAALTTADGASDRAAPGVAPGPGDADVGGARGDAVGVRADAGAPVVLPTPDPQIRVAGSGWGHGVGMSQYGAYAQARRGWAPRRILRHWYSGVDVGDGDSTVPIVVNLSTSARSPQVVVETGAARWQACSPRCTWLTGSGDARLTQRAGSGPWTIVATAGGGLSVRDGDKVLWRGTTGTTLRVQLSQGGQRTVARVLGQRYGWGMLEIGAHDGAKCGASALCVNVRVPNVERYLYGLAEMPSGWPDAALAAQAIVGRTYALRMIERGTRATCRCHLLATQADQVYVGLAKEEGASGDRWVARVDATAGKVVRYRGALAATFYSSSHGGRSERIEDSYAYSAPLSAYPYLRSVADPYSSDPAVRNPYARWTMTVPNAGFARYVDSRLRRVTGVSIRSRTAGGTPKELAVTGMDGGGRTLTIDFAGAEGKLVAGRRVWIAGAELKRRFDLRSQQITRIGLAPFSDDDGNAHEYAIVRLAAADITTGCAADRFCPGAPVTRAQMASLLVRALRLPAASVDAFSDDDGSVHEADINALARAGLINGCTSTEVCPGQPLTRAQMASLLVRALRLPAASVDAFSDDDGTAHEDSINRLAAAGITGGTANRRFRPGATVTRAQLASFVVRALDRP
jgi:SpoIID/LytB domain protein